MHPLLFFHNPYLPDHVTYSLVTMTILIVFAYLATRRMDLYPKGWQNIAEVVIVGTGKFITDTMGPEGKKMFPVIATLGLYILVSNLIGLFPGFTSPTANLNTTVSLALVVFFTTHAIGIRAHGWKYIKQFLGPVWWLTPLMLPIEIISHLARPLSLSVRLFGNMEGGHIVLGVLFFLAPLFVPLPIMALKLIIALIQTLVFVILSMMYFAGAMEEAHH